MLALQAFPLFVVAPGFVPALPDFFRLSRSVRCKTAVSSSIFATEGTFFEIYKLGIFLHRSKLKQSPKISQLNTFDDFGNMLLV